MACDKTYSTHVNMIIICLCTNTIYFESVIYHQRDMEFTFTYIEDAAVD